jgi:hypothetical protein
MQISSKLAALTAKLREREVIKALALYGAATWLTVAFAGYALALGEFAKVPLWLLTTGSRRYSGAITEFKAYGWGQSQHYRLRVANSADLSIPEEIAYPLWTGNADPNRYLAELLHDGKAVTVTVSGGKYPVVLDLAIQLPGEKQEKLLDAGDSTNRFGVVRTSAERKVLTYWVLAVIPLPGLFLYRRKRRA